MDGLHSLASTFHCRESLSVDVCRFDSIDLLLEGPDLGYRLFQAVLMRLLPSQCGLGGCGRRYVSVARCLQSSGDKQSALPFLFVLTFFRAMASCSSIWDCRCFSRFCSMSSCDRRPRIAFFGLSLRFCAAPPPNHPQMPADMMISLWVRVSSREECCANKVLLCSSARSEG